ncbi:KAR5 [[Candida] subhashii]|uniref:KAR5 n=1 Tax=[Candida] subhashii TaxID=561895 RepID=A0A8J5QJ55_9ASCO|nr:KAR5 [[Candida] subhashii]KAG7665661.1 KAR5 [[Candida] subhashii]
MQENRKYSEEMQDGIRKKFEEMVSVVDEILDEKRREKREMEGEMKGFKENFELVLNNAMVVLGNSYDGVDTNLGEMGKHLSYFVDEIKDLYELMRQEKQEIKDQQVEIMKVNDKITKQSEKVLDNMDMIESNVNQYWQSSQNMAIDIQTKIQYSSFNLDLLNNLIDKSIDDYILQSQYIDNQTSIILHEIAIKFTQELNLAASETILQFEVLLSKSLSNINIKINQTEQSIDDLNTNINQVIGIFQVGSRMFETGLNFTMAITQHAKTIPSKIQQLAQVYIDKFTGGFQFGYNLFLILLIWSIFILFQPLWIRVYRLSPMKWIVELMVDNWFKLVAVCLGVGLALGFIHLLDLVAVK